ncbi:probable disease resistance RPP8-like protein 4 [Telopea speciosissima]|uniref:probable disease resistance RPP8-like protein 4 n=1 Tax=Telopea speciosissima TaxID=54955 RepID=UPI001CC737F9|nr:probable disease resistance RPP8-like protein 4 [Telopea speciosissima]
MAVSVILILIQKLGSLLIDEANYLSQVKPEVESLRKELRLMTAFFKDADAIYHKSEPAKEWVRQLKELAFEVEDAIDIFVYEEAKKRGRKIVGKITKFPKLVINAHQLRGKIQDINGKIKKLKDDRINYDIKPKPVVDQGGQTWSTTDHQAQHHHQLEASSSAQKFRPVDVVGLQSEAEELAKLLMEEKPLGRFGVVSVIGMGGLGKTTLAQKIYNRDDVKKHFVCQAWVRLSKEYRMKDVLCNIIKQVMVLTEAEKDALASKEAGILEEKLSDFLKEKKNYLFLLDDVWAKEDWDKLKNTFPVPCNSQKCRVLLTTRDEGVARHADPIAPNPFKLQLLDEENSLKLFSKVFFRSTDDTEAVARLNSLDKEMKHLAMDIVKKCDGLPLAIVVLGGLLSDKRLTTPIEWKKVLDSVKWHLDSSNCQKVLALSYSELPSHLKPLFLYFGVFPEDTEMRRDRLIQLWGAEGFLEPRGNLRMEDVGGECLEELMQRNLIQVAKWKSNGVPESFIIRDPLLNLAISEAKESNFLNIISTPQESLNCYRRVALQDKHGENNMAEEASYNFSSSMSSNSNQLLRSLLCFIEMSPSLYGQFKLLNVLDLEGAPGIKSLPKEIRKLIFLKYMNLSRTSLETLPPWVGNLYNLQTLSVVGTEIESLPIEILKLGKLRNLLFYGIKMKQAFNDSIVGNGIIGIYRRQHSPHHRHVHHLSDLQTLFLPSGDWIENGLEKLTGLRDLRILGVDMEKFREKLSQALVNLVRLEALNLSDFRNGKTIFPSLSNHVYLHYLYIYGRIQKLPDLHNFPPNLATLQLSNTHLKEDMMRMLEKLPQLKDLSLWSTYDGVVMKCYAGGFSKLESLCFVQFDWLRYWIVEEGAMPNLSILEIKDLFGLKWIPGGLRHITTLQKLTLAMPKEFLERVEEGEKHWEKIKHVPSINTREVEGHRTEEQFTKYERKWFTATGEMIPDDDH